MKPTLRMGSRGPDVIVLQETLNGLGPAGAAKLVPDGAFGMRTSARVKQVQQLLRLIVDGVVGLKTWGAILASPLQRPGAAPPPTTPVPTPTRIPTPTPTPIPIPTPLAGNIDAKRAAIAAQARSEFDRHTSTIRAKLPGGKDPTTGRTLRAGHDRLLEYFRVTSPDPNKPGSTYWGDDQVRFLWHPGQIKPMPHWCGIFALWVVKSSGLSVGTWKMGHGIYAVTGFKQVQVPQVGDVVAQAVPNQHHAIVEKIEHFGGQTFVHSIDGNSGMDSRLTSNRKLLSAWSHYYSVSELA